MHNTYIRLTSIMMGKMAQQLNLPYLSNLHQELCEKINAVFPSRLEEVRNKPVLIGGKIGNSPLDSWLGEQSDKIHSIPDTKEQTLLASIDSSSLPIAQLEQGFVFASRMSIVFSLNGCPRKFIRIGPLLHYVKERRFGGLGFTNSKDEDPITYTRFIRSNLEHFAAQLLSEMHGTCILIDGSLAYWDLRSVQRSRATYIGISKSSSLSDLKVYSHLLTNNTKGCKYAKVLSQTDNGYQTLFVRFKESPFIFRVDVATNANETGYLLGLIKNNDSFSYGYPESLKLAHHLSIFTKLEILSLRSKVLSKYNPVEIPSYNLRKAILGDAHYKGT